MSYARIIPELRFWTKVLPVESGCWEWQGCLKGRGYRTGRGYGQFLIGGKHTPISAHRFSYEQFVGAIPVGHVVMHRCDNPRCVRPEHLTTGTYSDNTKDMYAKGRFPMADREARKRARKSA